MGGQLIDQNTLPVIDPATGLLRTTAFSFWSAQPDGATVTSGGAASRVPLPAARLLFSNLVDNNLSSLANRVQNPSPPA